ncbi:hypothetical protein Q4Q35_01430 [Flavivirga aquimarina]|uniref:Lipocalin-like domain-containing protein n=1 Tax=Flavivirga aquimarina TaxID=2027862 RepID=A0ABT8W5R7_9FLAO|nr:hypothetical protein [Flavivirga aquimarina]MDO5968458.1 hypothetical protein [Flavivirga aquimarina]
MKFKYYYLLILLLFIACNDTKGELVTADENLIVGKWVKIEAYISVGGPQYWVDVENGEEIDFFENGTFFSNRFKECTTGNFSIEENILLLEYTCNGFNPVSENEKGFITYKLDFLSDYFILTPISGPICIEGCSYKYQRKK